jgi:CubicO group peptidase (beta-lactamase class C family)
MSGSVQSSSRLLFILPVPCVVALAFHAVVWATPQPTPRPNLEAARVAAASIPRLNSLLVSWRGHLALEHYGKGIRASRPVNVKSVSKSVISALVGIAIERRLIPGVTTPLTTYFPQLLQDPAAEKRKITIEDLLTMRSGLESTSFDNYGSWVRSRNWVQYVLAQPVVAEPGQSMEYSTGSTHLLSAILTKATRTSTYQFAQGALAKPLGFTLAPWPRDPQGIYFGGNDMLLTPRQMVTFGELYLRRGAANGRQIVPAAWVETSCVPRGQSRFNPDQRYGYGWWTRQFGGHDSCFAWGFGGQYIFVFRDLDLVVATTSIADVSDEHRDHRRLIFDLLERFVIPQIEAPRSKPLPNS